LYFRFFKYTDVNLFYNKIFENQSRTNRLIIAVIIGVGGLTAILQFLSNRDMLMDESWLALNILDRNFIELLRPLDYNQAGPPLFLWAEKLFSILIPNSAMGFRFFPLLSFVVSLLFLNKLIIRIIPNSFVRIIIVALFSFNNMLLIYGSTQGKQYMSDVMTLLILFYLTVKEYSSNKNRYNTLMIVGSLSILMSNVAPVILLTIGLYIFFSEFIELRSKTIVPWTVVFGVWAVVFGVYYYFFVANHPLHDFMLRYWAGTFMPLNSSSDFWLFCLDRAYFLSGCFISNKIPLHFTVLVPIVGIASMIVKKQYGLLILSLSPVVIHLALSAFRLYPFEARMLLYSFPCIIIIVSYGVYYTLKAIFFKFSPTVVKIVIYLLPIFCAYYYFGFCLQAQKKEEVKPSIDFIKQNKQEGESIYLNVFASPVYHFYEKTGYISFPNVIEGRFTTVPIYNSSTVSELDSLRGRTWLLFSSCIDEEVISRHLDSLGIKKLQEYHFRKDAWEQGMSSALLYDFGD